MLKNTLNGANRRPYSVTLYTIFYTYVRDYKYRSQMDPYHYELYTKSILNNKLLLLAVTEPTKWRLSWAATSQFSLLSINTYQ